MAENDALTADDIAQIVDGIVNFIIEGSSEVEEIWQPYIDKLNALRESLQPKLG